MIKFTFTLLSILLVFTAFGQQKEVGSMLELAWKSADLTERSSTDTIQPVPLAGCNTAPLILGSANGGYVAGTNGYGDLEKAQLLTASEATNVTAALILFGAKNISGTPDNFRAKVYSAGTNGPDALLGTSEPVSSADIDTSGAFTRFDFANPVAVDGAFFIAVEVDMENNNDEIGIAHTDDECGGDSAWEMWDDGSWVAFSSSSSWGIDLLLFMFAEVSTAVNTGNHLIAPGSHFVFPNPVSEKMTLMYSLSGDADVNISVMDMQGRLISTVDHGIQPAGTYNQQFDTANFPAGLYIYQITSSESTVQGKFTVK